MDDSVLQWQRQRLIANGFFFLLRVIRQVLYIQSLIAESSFLPSCFLVDWIIGIAESDSEQYCAFDKVQSKALGLSSLALRSWHLGEPLK
ncbi:hypothetical protein L6452_33843 [Arctium lappa]|uniref:Uncharacterized protein n=1 Tax=Arctium lappa TaxID=4217 RepID=A0ACB8YH48_ARCLA|nr:hypothetical protein L6452_33843 [Arctium lappa]